MKISVLKNPSPSEVEEITDLFLRAFEHHIPTKACTADLPKIKHEFFRLAVLAGALEGQILVLKDGVYKEKILSASVSFGPGVLFMSSEKQRALGYDKFLESLPDTTKEWWANTYNPLTEKLIESTIGGEAALNAWVPILIGTLPEHQHKGYGTAITKQICKLAGNSTVSLISTEDYTVTFYKGLGFKVEAKVEVPSDFGEFPTNTRLTPPYFSSAVPFYNDSDRNSLSLILPRVQTYAAKLNAIKSA